MLHKFRVNKSVALIVIFMLLYHSVLYMAGSIPGCPPSDRKRQAKESLLILFNSIKLSNEYLDVCEVLAFHNPYTLSLSIAPWDANVWILRTPFEISAKNWIMYIEFHDNLVVGKYIRYYDSRNFKPIYAPADALADGHYVHPEFEVKMER